MKRRSGPPVESMPAHLETFDPAEWAAMSLGTAFSSWVNARAAWVSAHPDAVSGLEVIRENRRVRLWVADQVRAP